MNNLHNNDNSTYCKNSILGKDIVHSIQPMAHLAIILKLLLLLTIGVTTAHAQSDAYQPFEHGYMIWDSATGGIWVLYGGTEMAEYYPQSSYENLPDNPSTVEPPADFISPTSGFGRIWGNFQSVQQLGWATAPEQNFNFNLRAGPTTAGGFEQQVANLPGNTEIVIRSDNSWGVFGQPRSIRSLPPVTTFPASFQEFENGAMLWWSETGTIWVLYNNGVAERYDSVQYGNLPENPILITPPAGFSTPIHGFGKLWGNDQDLRLRLGWAIGPEISYQMDFELMVDYVPRLGHIIRFGVDTPHGHIEIRNDSGWNFR